MFHRQGLLPTGIVTHSQKTNSNLHKCVALSHSLAHRSQRLIDTSATTRVTVGSQPLARQRHAVRPRNRAASNLYSPFIYWPGQASERATSFEQWGLGLTCTLAPLWRDPNSVKSTLLVNRRCALKTYSYFPGYYYQEQKLHKKELCRVEFLDRSSTCLH